MTRAQPTAPGKVPAGFALAPLLEEWLMPAYHNPLALAKQFQSAKPYPHIVLPRVFRPAKVDMLRDAMIALAEAGGFTHKDSDLFSLAQTADFKTSADPAVQELRSFFQSTEWRSYLSVVTGVALTGKQLDMGGSLYQDTDFLLCHDDRVTGRKIAYICYLGPDFSAKDGGALALRNATKTGEPGTVVHRYPPKYGTLAMFTVSAVSWHEVEEVTGEKPRLSINGWFH